MKVDFAGRSVEVEGHPDDPYFGAVAAHAASMAGIMELMASLPDHPVVLDIGANIGLSSIAMAIARPEARIIAFEPSPENLSFLRRNVDAFPNVEIVEAAVSDRPGTLLFHAARYGAGSHVVSSGHIDGGLQTAAVPALRLDDFASEHLIEPDLIKIDVEGHEPEVLAGAARTIARSRPVIAMEFNSWTLNAFAGHSPASFARALWNAFDIEDQRDAMGFLHDNLVVRGCVSDIVMRLKTRGRVPSLAEMSFSRAARDTIAATVRP